VKFKDDLGHTPPPIGAMTKYRFSSALNREQTDRFRQTSAET